MKHFTHITLDTGLGTINDIFEEAKELALIGDAKVSFKFNGILFNITKRSTLVKCWEDYITNRTTVFGEGW